MGILSLVGDGVEAVRVKYRYLGFEISKGRLSNMHEYK